RCYRDWSSDVCSSDLVRDQEPKAAPLSGFALNPDAPTLHLDQPLAEHQAQAGPLERPGGRAVELLKFREQARLVFGPDPDPGVRSEERRVGKACRFRV